MKIYKYMGPEVLTKAFPLEGVCTFKCSFPKDFNDPYELFLTIDFQQDPEILAYYSEVVGEIHQRPATCFSKSPCIIPMWAHYAHNHRGVVVEIDESVVLNHFPEIAFGDVDYLDETNEGLLDLLKRAFLIGKPRYHYLLQRGVYSAAYHTKQTCWQHEVERRLIAKEKDVIKENGMMLLKLPLECVSALIVGHNANEDTKNNVASLADEIGAEYYKLKIGRMTASPFFVDSVMSTYEFNGDTILSCDNYCQNCNEPIDANNELCSWCAIEEEHKSYAASNNPFRALHGAGILGEYIKSMNEISEK